MSRLISLLFHDVYRGHPIESGFPGSVAGRYKVSVAEFARALEAVEAPRPHVAVIRDDPDAANSDGLTFTFDDGGVSYATAVADALEARGWRGHCFVSTDMIGRPGFLTAAQIRDLDRRGHVIGSHSATHPSRFSACEWPCMLGEWAESRAVLEDLLGHGVRIASLPGGYLSRRAALSAADAGIRVLFTSEPVARPWHVSTCTLLGRYTVRAGQPIADLRDLASGARGPLVRQWVSWNAKKCVKPVLGPVYPRLGEWVAARRHA